MSIVGTHLFTNAPGKSSPSVDLHEVKPGLVTLQHANDDQCQIVDTAISIDHFIDCDRYYIENRSFFSTWKFCFTPFCQRRHLYRTKDVNQRRSTDVAAGVAKHARPPWALGAASPARTLITPSGRSSRKQGCPTKSRHFAAAGLKKPDISILSDEFLAEVRGMPQRNLAFELLQKLLTGEIKTRSRRIWRRRPVFGKPRNNRCAAISGRPANGWAPKQLSPT